MGVMAQSWRRPEEPMLIEADERYLTQNEACSLCGCDYSTVKRHRMAGHFPGVRRRPDPNGTYEIPLTDLIAAGLWDPAEGDAEDVAAAFGRTKVERRLEETRLALERANARIEALLAAIEDRRDEIAYLRRALEAALTGRAAA
jgi:hypothetical protein